VDGGIDLSELVRRGVAVVVATRDVRLRPDLARAWGPELSHDGARLTVCVEAPAGSRAQRNLVPGRTMAATLALISSAASVQLNGPVLAVGEPGPERLAAVADHVERFVQETAAVGAHEPIVRRMVGNELLAVTMELAARPGHSTAEPS
jgi:hypothetical protein